MGQQQHILNVDMDKVSPVFNIVAAVYRSVFEKIITLLIRRIQCFSPLHLSSAYNGEGSTVTLVRTHTASAKRRTEPGPLT